MCGIFSEKASLELISVAKASYKIVFAISSFPVTFDNMSWFCKWIEEAGIWSPKIKWNSKKSSISVSLHSQWSPSMAMPFFLLSRSALFVIFLNPAQAWIRNLRQDTDDQLKSAAEENKTWAEYLAPSRHLFKLVKKGHLQGYFSQTRKVFKRGINPKMHTSKSWGPESIAGLAMSQYIVPFYWGAPEGITIPEQTWDVLRL